MTGQVFEVVTVRRFDRDAFVPAVVCDMRGICGIAGFCVGQCLEPRKLPKQCPYDEFKPSKDLG